VALLAFAGAQLAVSVHACTPVESRAVAHAHTDCHDAGSDAGTSEARSALCKKHCENNGQQHLNAWPADLSAAMAVLVQPSVHLADLADSGSEACHALSPERVGIPDPPFLRSPVLLI
jgi:hypothetical protein